MAVSCTTNRAKIIFSLAMINDALRGKESCLNLLTELINHKPRSSLSFVLIPVFSLSEPDNMFICPYKSLKPIYSACVHKCTCMCIHTL